MNPANIYHRPLSEYAFALDDSHYVFRLRTGKNEAVSCTFYYADRAAMTPDLSFHETPMIKKRSDCYFDWYEVDLVTSCERIAYYFELKDGTSSLCYYGDCFEKIGNCSRSDYFQFPFNHRANRIDIPKWLPEAVVYNIFPDSFASDKRYISNIGKRKSINGCNTVSRLGGTINGIRKNLDYIEKLGCTCIYLNPVFAAGEYHKYNLVDYYHVDPCMGTDADLKNLVEEAHIRNMRIILDGVFNHVSTQHPMFQDVLKHGKSSRYYSCFYNLPEYPALPSDGEQPSYTCFSYVSEMPKTNTADPYLQEYFCEIGTYWIREYSIDGWRLDVANELDDSFLRAFRKAVKKENPEALIIGEVWENASHYLKGDMMDSAMNYDFRRYCQRFFADQTVSAEIFDTNISTLLYRYPTSILYGQLNLLDSHDVSRFFTVCNQNIDKMELAVLFQMTFPGMPCVFYGDEKGIIGEEEFEYRSPMPWRNEHVLEEIYQKLIFLRKSKPALQHGDFTTIIAAGYEYAYCRTWKDQKITVVMNLGTDDVQSTGRAGTLILKKGENHGIIKQFEYEVREDIIDVSDNL